MGVTMRNEKEWTTRRRILTQLVEEFLRLYQSDSFQVASKAISEHTCANDFFVPVEFIPRFEKLILPCLKAVKLSQATRVDEGLTGYNTCRVRDIDIFYFIKTLCLFESMVRSKQTSLFQLYSSLEVKYENKYYNDIEDIDPNVSLATPVLFEINDTTEFEYQIITNDTPLGVALRGIKLNHFNILSDDHHKGYAVLYKDVLKQNRINEFNVFINFAIDTLACFSITFGGLGNILSCKQCDTLYTYERKTRKYCSEACRKKYCEEKKIDALRCFKRNKLWYEYAYGKVSRHETNIRLKTLYFDICNECKCDIPLQKGGDCPFWLKDNQELHLKYRSMGRTRIKTDRG
ncbi:MAG: hypothetical protein HQK82_08220 [Desulfovibrionaceae bacterium]|nr:hypothetical protein [Desulfovibrionaceae bacterium]